MYNLIKVVVIALLLLYPVFVYFGIKYFSLSHLSLFLLFLFVARFVFTRKGNKTARLQMVLTVLIGGSLVGLSWLFNTIDYLKWYPVGLNIIFFLIFFSSLLSPPSIIEQIARLHRKDLPPSGIVYTRNVTIIWTAFFVINALISSWTVLYGSMEIWTLYNGLISYIIMGTILGLEILLRNYFVEPPK